MVDWEIEGIYARVAPRSPSDLACESEQLGATSHESHQTTTESLVGLSEMPFTKIRSTLFVIVFIHSLTKDQCDRRRPCQLCVRAGVLCVPSRKIGAAEKDVAVDTQASSSLDQIRPGDEEKAVLPEQSILELSTKVRFPLGFIAHSKMIEIGRLFLVIARPTTLQRCREGRKWEDHFQPAPDHGKTSLDYHSLPEKCSIH